MIYPAIIALVLAASPQFQTLTGKVVKVTDGDTITVVDSENHQVKVRLNGIDSPESGQAFGTKAKQALSDKVFGKSVDVLWAETDRYGRTIGIVKIDGKNINTQMVDEGFAWMYRKYTSSPTLDKEEAAARAAKAGLWSEANPVAPWDYRKQKSAASRAKRKKAA